MRFLSTLVASVLGTLLAAGFLMLIGFFFIFSVMSFTARPTPSVAEESVLVVELDGTLPERVTMPPPIPFVPFFPDAQPYSLRDFTQALEKAAADERISGVWLQFENLNAQWAALEEARAALLAFKESGKPLLASSADYAMTEGEYFLASAADSLFAAPEAFFEFNGFAIIQPFFQETLNKLHIEPQVVRAGKYKSAVEPFLRRDLSPANEEQLTALLGSINEHFLETVVEGRGLTADSLRRLASEEAVLTAHAAHAAGLLDGLLYRDQVEDRFHHYLSGYEANEPIETISLAHYMRVPRSTAGLETDAEGTVAIVYAEGRIVSGEGEKNPFDNAAILGAESFVATMQDVRRSEHIDAVVVRINSPGGSASASDAMWRAMKLTADEKPLVVSMGNVAASGGYWMATAADTIVADPLTITGSIGVFGLLFDLGDFFSDKLGVTFDGVRTSPYADLFSGVQPLTPAERQLLEQAISATYQRFLHKVAESREQLTVGEVDAIAQGRVWMGADALQIGLVDTLGSLEDALQIAAHSAGLDAFDTRAYPRPKPFYQRLAETLFFPFGRAWVRWTTSPAERLLLEQRRFLHRLDRMHGTVQAWMPLDLVVE